MNSTVLLVDDEPSVLRGYQRNIGQMFDTAIATSGEEALEMLKKEDKYALIMSDYRMGGITGVELLRKARELRPNTVRMLITGYADVKISLDAINEGSVFRMLTKPCEQQSFYRAIEDGLRQHELVTIEKELLDQTLKGAVQMLGDIISVLDQRTFGRSQKLSWAAQAVGKALGLEKLWELEVAAILSEVGRATLPVSVVSKHLDAVNLTEAEERLLSTLPETSYHLLAHIPRLESVAKNILYQNKNFDGSGFPADGLRGEYLPVGARILRILKQLQADADADIEIEKSLEELARHHAHYDLAIVKTCQTIATVLSRIFSKQQLGRRRVPVLLRDLQEGQRLSSSIQSTDGVMVIAAGSIITPAILQRIKNFASIMPIKQPIEIIVD